MPQFGVAEAKTSLSRLLERVAQGERIIITRHGLPVAQLLPPAPQASESLAEIVEEIKRLRAANAAEHVDIEDIFEETWQQ